MKHGMNGGGIVGESKSLTQGIEPKGKQSVVSRIRELDAMLVNIGNVTDRISSIVHGPIPKMDTGGEGPDYDPGMVENLERLQSKSIRIIQDLEDILATLE
jgi:hypothetical protein